MTWQTAGLILALLQRDWSFLAEKLLTPMLRARPCASTGRHKLRLMMIDWQQHCRLDIIMQGLFAVMDSRSGITAEMS